MSKREQTRNWTLKKHPPISVLSNNKRPLYYDSLLASISITVDGTKRNYDGHQVLLISTSFLVELANVLKADKVSPKSNRQYIIIASCPIQCIRRMTNHSLRGFNFMIFADLHSRLDAINGWCTSLTWFCTRHRGTVPVTWAWKLLTYCQSPRIYIHHRRL